MTTTATPIEALSHAFEERVAPIVFSEVEPEESPTLTLLVDPPGAAAGRLLGAMSADRRAAVVSTADLRSFDAEGSPESAAEWLRLSLAHARERRLPLVVEGAFGNASVVIGTARGFAREGFRTRVAIVVPPRPVSLLTVTAVFLAGQRTRRPVPLVSVGAHDAGWSAARNLLAALESGSGVDRVSLFDDRGTEVVDSDSAVGASGVVAAFDASRARSLTVLEAAEWLSQLRRLAEFAQARPTLPAAAVDALMALHQVALAEVIQQLPVPAGSLVRAEQEHRVAARLVSLRRPTLPPAGLVPPTVISGPDQPARGVSR